MNDDLFTLPPDAPPQLRRAAIFVSVGDFANADVYCEKVLDETPENAYAYLLKAMTKCKAQKAEQLVAVPGLSEMTEFKLARQFADAELAAKLDALGIENTQFVAEQKRAAKEAAMAAAEQKRAAEEAAMAAAARQARDNSVRTGCAVRIRTLQELLARDIPDDLAAEVRTRLDAEQALMRAPTPDAAEREADLTAALREKIAPYCRTQLAELLPQLEGLLPNQNLPKNCRDIAAKRGSEIRALLEDPGVDLRTLCYEWERCKVDHEELSREIAHRNIGLWIAVGVLILLAILAYISTMYKA